MNGFENFLKDKKEAEKIEDLQERLLFYKKRYKDINCWTPKYFIYPKELFEKYELEIDYIQEQIKSQPQQSKETPPPPIANKYYQFDNRIIETIIFSDKLEAFYNIEKALFDKKKLSSEGKWIVLKPLLVAFIHILIKLEYVRPIINSKSKDNSLNYIRQYFENRYLTDITQQMKPSRFDVTKLHNYHPDFINIIPEIDLIKK